MHALSRYIHHETDLFSCLGWFGIRKDFCEYLLGMIPCLREYGKKSFITEAISEELITHKRTSVQKEAPKQTAPVLRIDVPD
jgi:hypothetical protein